jgi:hypothetical protein
MSASNEWTEWHLTPGGWERGTEKDDFSRTDREPPSNRVLSVKWSEYLGHSHGTMQRGHEELWRSTNAALVSQLIKQFGETPASL